MTDAKKPECTCGQGYDPECPSDHGANPDPIRAAAEDMIEYLYGYKPDFTSPNTVEDLVFAVTIIRAVVERERERAVQEIENAMDGRQTVSEAIRRIRQGGK